MRTDPSPDDSDRVPAAIRSVGSEIAPGSPEVWRPANVEEWERHERMRVALHIWSQQLGHERDLRTLVGKNIFVLIVVQVIAMFGIIVADGANLIDVDTTLLKIAVPSVFAEVLGLGYVATKYLFNKDLRGSLDTLIREVRDGS